MKKRCLSRAVLAHDMLEAVPLFISAALASSACAFAGLLSKPSPSPPLSAAFAEGLRNPVLVAPASTVIVADWLTPYVPVIVTDVSAVTGDVVMVKLAKPWPAGTVTLAGTCATEGLLLESVTFAPPAGAEPVRNTVAEMLLPPVVPLTLGVTELSVGGAFGSGYTLIHWLFVTDPDCALI